MDYDEDDFLEAAQRTAKQKYLREEIIEMDYSTEEFVAFMESRGGADINFWSFEELQGIVKEFKNSHKPYLPEELDLLTKEDEQKEDEPVFEEPEHLYTRQYSRQTTNLFKNTQNEIKKEMIRLFSREGGIRQLLHHTRPNPPLPIESIDAFKLKVCPLEKGELKDGKVTVLVSQPKLVGGSFFSAKEVEYLLQTQQAGWEVQRKESHFLWLRNILNMQYPGHIPVPDLPKRIKSIDPSINYRIQYLQQWLQGIIRNEVYRNSPEFLQFLSQTDQQEFKKFIQQSEKRPMPDIYNLYSTQGAIMLDPNLMADQFNMYDQYMKRSELLKRTFAEQYKKLATLLQDSEEVFNKLQETSTQMQELNREIECGGTQVEMLENIKNIFKQWSNYLQKQARFLVQKVSPFYKYQYKEVQQYNKFVNAWSDKKAYYERGYYRLMQKKEKLWDRGNIMSWELSKEDYEFSDIGALLTDKEIAFEKMCFKETKALELMHAELQYYNYQIVNEAQRVQIDNTALDALLYKNIAQTMEKDYQKLQNKWRDFFQVLDKLIANNVPHRDFLD